MKRELLTIAVAIAATVGLSHEAKSQTLIKQVTVNVELKDVIGVTPEGPIGASVVDFVYETAEDYNNTKQIIIPSQFTITSTRAFNVLVKGTGDFIGQTTAANTLPLNILRLSARNTGMASFGGELTPTTADQAIITGSPATLGQGFDVLYSIPQNASLLTESKQLYSTEVIYSVAAQ